ncbi:sterile alpha motif domain-containing protein 13 isoform X2 [Podarcis raffonei]|uniref:sterile alpha motif domain-containing protein 13 isoform X2 n=1 Tax=Podarcis raffonei TaxID=65483 RepID=UPI0023299C2A|nr:sterile alpha motif domain-containing protein 13 isoform X2 [Podarcis raffonei]
MTPLGHFRKSSSDFGAEGQRPTWFERGRWLIVIPGDEIPYVLSCFKLKLRVIHGASLVENGRPPDPADWAVTDVVNYFRTVGFEEQAHAFQEQEIDGKSLLLMTRNDVLTGLSLKLGPALKIYEYHVKPLQTQHLKNTSL